MHTRIAPFAHTDNVVVLRDTIESVATAESTVPDDGIIKCRYFGMTDVGLVRGHNEDNLLTVDLEAELRGPTKDGNQSQATIVGERGLVLAICDGIGEAGVGEVASQVAVDTIHEVMQSGAAPGGPTAFAERLVLAIEEAGARIHAAARNARSLDGMGARVTAAGLVDRFLCVAQVGDSSCFILRDEALSLVTNPCMHEALSEGADTPPALGISAKVNVAMSYAELRRGDRVMLCSDGLSSVVDDDVIQDVMTKTKNQEDVASQLIELANAGGGHDNVTCIVADFDGDGLQVPQEFMSLSHARTSVDEFVQLSVGRVDESGEEFVRVSEVAEPPSTGRANHDGESGLLPPPFPEADTDAPTFPSLPVPSFEEPRIPSLSAPRIPSLRAERSPSPSPSSVPPPLPPGVTPARLSSIPPLLRALTPQPRIPSSSPPSRETPVLDQTLPLEIVELTYEPNAAALEHVAGVLRQYPEVESAAFALARRGQAAPTPVFGLRVHPHGRTRVVEIFESVRRAATEAGLQADVLLLYKPQQVRSIRLKALLFFPRRVPTKPPPRNSLFS